MKLISLLSRAGLTGVLGCSAGLVFDAAVLPLFALAVSSLLFLTFASDYRRRSCLSVRFGGVVAREHGALAA